MADARGAGRTNQRNRTRKDLLQAASRLMKMGTRPTLDEIAEEAMVSRATAYRYFPGVDALLLEASLDVAFPTADELFGDGAGSDPVARLHAADAAVDAMIAANEPQLRMMLIQSLERSLREDSAKVAIRQNRRSTLIEAALDPARDQFEPARLATLRSALALVIGPEGRLVFKDVLQLKDTAAHKVKCWMIDALVQAARKESDRHSPR